MVGAEALSPMRAWRGSPCSWSRTSKGVRVLQDVMLGRKPREDGEGRMDFMRACKPLQRTLFYFEGDMEMLEAMGNMTQPRY